MRTARAERAEQRTKEIGGFLPVNGFSGTNSDTIGESALLLLLKQGDPEGLQYIKRKYHDKLYSVAYRICNNHPDAEEVLQDPLPVRRRERAFGGEGSIRERRS